MDSKEPIRARCLIVDDDDWSREYVVDLLKRFGITAELARDGLEAAALLDDNAYDLVFLDLDLPKLPGEAVLEGLVTNRRRPGSIVVMSGAVDRLERVAASDWDRLGISTALPKPVAAAEVRAALQRALSVSTPVSTTWTTGPGSVVIAGNGLWAQALSRVVTRGGGTLTLCDTQGEALTKIADRKPPAIVAGPPTTAAEMPEFFAAARLASPRSSLFAALPQADMALRRELAAIGVARVFLIPNALGELAVSLVTAATLNTRSHPRVPVTAGALVLTGDQKVSATTRDVSEGGLCLEGIRERIPRGPARVEFGLPGAPMRVAAESHVVWVAGSDGEFRAGLRFERVSEGDRSQIKKFVQLQLS